MGNFIGKCHPNRNDDNWKISATNAKECVKFPNVKQDNWEVSVSDTLIPSRFSPRSFISQKSNTSFSTFTRPWSRISRRKWDEKTLANPLTSSKTAWPVPYFESLFLPEFKIRNDISEDSFYITGTISCGAFSNVYKVLKKGSNEVYAMKVLSKAQLVANNLINQVKEEVKIQQVISHNPFIVNCCYYWQSRKQLYIVSEYVCGGELLKLLQNKGPLPLNIIRLYVAELALALDFLHNAGIIYRDLKQENILINAKGHVQIIDFGLSKWLKYGMRTNTICGTLQYIAPEILQQKPYGHAIDWWSLGIVLTCMIIGEGTIGLVHMSCLEKWLSMSNTHSCELCGYNFQTLRTPRYRVLYSIYYWVFLDRNPQYHRGLKSDFIVFVVLTPIAFIGVYSCIVAADFYSKEPNKYSPASRWTTISLLIMVVLLTFAYYLWVAVTIRFHMRIWYIWWQANNIVKIMPRDPNASSTDSRINESMQSSDSRESNRRAAVEATESHSVSLMEAPTAATHREGIV